MRVAAAAAALEDLSEAKVVAGAAAVAAVEESAGLWASKTLAAFGRRPGLVTLLGGMLLIGIGAAAASAGGEKEPGVTAGSFDRSA